MLATSNTYHILFIDVCLIVNSKDSEVRDWLWNLGQVESRCLRMRRKWTVKNLFENEHKAWITDLKKAFQVGMMTRENVRKSVWETWEAG